MLWAVPVVPTFDSCVTPPPSNILHFVCFSVWESLPFLPPAYRVIETIIINSLVLRSTHLSHRSVLAAHYNEVITLCLSRILHWFQCSGNAILSSLYEFVLCQLSLYKVYYMYAAWSDKRCYWPAGRLGLSVCFGFSYFQIFIISTSLMLISMRVLRMVKLFKWFVNAPHKPAKWWKHLKRSLA